MGQTELDELMTAFAKETGTEGCEPDENGAYVLAIDDIEMMIAPFGEGGGFSFHADLGEPPAEGGEIVCRALLEASFPHTGGIWMTLSIDGESGRICLSCVVAKASADYAAFRSALESFVNTADDWRQKLAAFPAAFSKVETAVKKASDERRTFASGDFLRV